MPWLFFLLALAAFGLAWSSASVLLVVACLLAALGLLLAGALSLRARRVAARREPSAPADAGGA